MYARRLFVVVSIFSLYLGLIYPLFPGDSGLESAGAADIRIASMNEAIRPGPDDAQQREDLPALSVVVPTFNERDNVPKLYRKLEAALSGIAWEVIFVDDNSPDGTWKVVRELARKDGRVRCIRRIGRRGLSGACIEGILASSAPYAAVMDADLQHDETRLPKMLSLLEQGNADLVQVISTRGPNGWTSQDLTTPHAGVPGSVESAEYRIFSSDLSRVAVQPLGPFTPCRSEDGAEQPCLSPEATEQTAFIKTNYAGAETTAPCTASCFKPLVTSGNVPGGTAFGACWENYLCGPLAIDATPDLAAVLLVSKVALTPTSLSGGTGLYEWRDGKLSLVSSLPGKPEVAAAGGPQLGQLGRVTRNAL